MNDKQRAAFEAWYGIDYTTDVTLYPGEWSEGKQISWAAWQAALESPQVQDLKDALQSILYDMESEGRGTGYEYQNAQAVLAAMEMNSQQGG